LQLHPGRQIVVRFRHTLFNLVAASMHYALCTYARTHHNFVRFISIFGGGIPYIGDSAMEGAVALSTATWLFGCYKYFTGYQESAGGRQTGFFIRFLVVFFWLSGSAIGLGCAAWNRMK